jgi:hypothetical protein
MTHTSSRNGAQQAAETDTETYYAPAGALTWKSAAQRNQRLRAWRLAVSIAFAEQPRCLRIAWVLDHLFNVKTGFCNASNTYLAGKTGLTPRNLQKALAALESDGALVRGVTVQKGGQSWRAIYPAKAILTVGGVTSTGRHGGSRPPSRRTESEKETPLAEDATGLRPAPRGPQRMQHRHGTPTKPASRNRRSWSSERRCNR